MGRSKKEKGSGIKGCMNGMLHLFDFRQQPRMNLPNISGPSTATPTADPLSGNGARKEPPRTSVEKLTAIPAKDCLLMNDNQKYHLDEDADAVSPMGFKILARSEEGSKDSVSPSVKSKSPNVVARLMGMEILPRETETVAGLKENIATDPANRSNSNRFFDGREKGLKELNRKLQILEKECENMILRESRSLPSTPRNSLSRRSDVAEYRLSLQIEKENVPTFTNNNCHVDHRVAGIIVTSPTSSSSSSHLRNLDTRRRNCSSINAENKSTSPRLTALSSVSPWFGIKPLTVIRETNYSTPTCSPRLRTKPKTKLETQVCNSSSPRTQSAKPTVCSGPFLPESAAKESRPKTAILRGFQPKFEVEGVRRIGGGVSLSRESGKDPLRRLKERYVRLVKVNVEKKKKKRKTVEKAAFLRMKKGEGEDRSVKASKKEYNALRPRMLRTPYTASKQPSMVTTAPAQDGAHVAQHHDDQLSHHAHASRSSHQLPPPPSISKMIITCPHSHPPSINKLERSLKVEDTLMMHGCIKTILELMGVRSNTIVSYMHLHSPSHPLEPSIFIKLEACHHDQHHLHLKHHRHRRHHHDHVMMANTRSNRKLVFELVDELLRERMMACIMEHVRPWMMTIMTMMGQHGCNMNAMTGRQLLRHLWMDVLGIPSMDCKSVEDIDALIANDVSTGRGSSALIDGHDVNSVAETMIFRIGQEIAESLVGDLILDSLCQD